MGGNSSQMYASDMRHIAMQEFLFNDMCGIITILVHFFYMTTVYMLDIQEFLLFSGGRCNADSNLRIPPGTVAVERTRGGRVAVLHALPFRVTRSARINKR